jgi:phosphocarrier protein
MTACIKCGTEVELQCEGPDEVEMLQAAVALIKSGLGDEM